MVIQPSKMFSAPKFADNRRPGTLAWKMRKQRMRLFASLVHSLGPHVSIIDVGGTIAFWRSFAPEVLSHATITLVNLMEERIHWGTDHAEKDFKFEFVRAEARDLRGFSDHSFDIYFSNSVIEHVGTLYDQIAMANEARRVARSYFVQTPSRYFPIEPHTVMPLWPWWPIRLRMSLVQRMEVGWMRRERDALLAQAYIEQVRLLTAREFGLLFPDATIHRERIGPLTKSLIAVRPAPAA